MQGTAVLIAFVAALLFGAAAPLGKPLLKSLNDFQMAGLLYLGAGLGVIPVLIKSHTYQLPWQMRSRDAVKLLGAILFGGILGPLFLLAGLRLAAAGSVSLWLNMEMVATVLIGHFFFKDQLTRKGWIASVCALAAAFLLAWEGGVVGFRAGGLIILACICWGIDNHLTALIDGISPALSTFWKGLVAGSFNIVLGLTLASLSAAPWIILGGLGLGAFSYGISIMLYIIAAQDLGATRAQLIFAGAPFFGLLISLLLGESLSILQGIALLLFIGSVFFLFQESHRHLHAHGSFSHVHLHAHPDPHHKHAHATQIPEFIRHTHEHEHQPLEHSHPHLPDLHHRHDHG